MAPMTRDRVANPLEDTTRTSPAPQEPSDDRGDAYVLVLAGSNLGGMFKLDKDRLVLGRGEKADIRLIDDGLSREHALLVKSGTEVVLEDLGSTNGTYCNGERVQRRSLVEGDKILLGSTTILRFTYQDRLDEAFQRQMSESALRDGLTHAYNKRTFSERLDSEFQYALRHATPVFLVFIDIDHFKRINDAHGHPVGDAVLAHLASLVASMIGEDDMFARYGGEEFAIVVRSADGDAVAALAERIRAAVEGHPFVLDGSETRIPVTISVGIARAPAPGLASAADLISRADEAMYAAKRGGRNRVCITPTT
jgi:diguanylate cyclase (GGDEF)-like protein